MTSGHNNGDAGLMKQSGKDFVLEVCRESLRNRCSRSESQCRFAHPTSNIHVIDGKVQCCADFLKVKDYFYCALTTKDADYSRYSLS